MSYFSKLSANTYMQEQGFKHQTQVQSRSWTSKIFCFNILVLVITNSWPFICTQFQIFIPPGSPCNVTAQSKLLIWQISLLLWDSTTLQNYCFQKSKCKHSSDFLYFSHSSLMLHIQYENSKQRKSSNIFWIDWPWV